MITPALDGMAYNLNGSDPSGKMYNWTCGFYDSLSTRYPGQDDLIRNWKKKFHRLCPNGVKNCFWAQGEYASQSKYPWNIPFYMCVLFVCLLQLCMQDGFKTITDNILCIFWYLISNYIM